MKEESVEAALTRKVRELGGMSIKLLPTRSGVPDRMVVLPPGRIYLIELKTRTGPLRPAQRVWHKRAGALGVHVPILRGLPDVERWVEWAKAGGRGRFDG